MGVDFGPPAETRSLWQAERLGALFEHSRVRRIERAQDALSPVEQKVYDLLWDTRKVNHDDYRLVHYSLQRIANEARINIKTVRELIPRLIDKGFIAIEHEADPRRNLPTLYRVWSAGNVLDQQRRMSRLHAARTGKGVFYVHPVAAAISLQPAGDELTPMGLTPSGLDPPPTGYSSTPMDLERKAPPNQISQVATSAATVAAISAIVRRAFGSEPDTELLESMIAECHQRSLKATGASASDEELLYFTEAKTRVLSQSSNIRNHLGVLRRALPECFSGEAFRAYRAAAGYPKREADGL